jgi:methionine sulfoxide reductase heme-binding subunit
MTSFVGKRISMPTATPAQLKAIKLIVFIAGMLPFVRLAVATLNDDLGANPLEFITRNTGGWTLYFLCLTLAAIPLRLTQWPWLIQLRCMLGLFVFSYATLHFTTFL